LDTLLDGLSRALRLLVEGDSEVWQAAWISIKIASISTALASSLGVPLGFLIGTQEFAGKGIIVALLNALMAIPTVVVGLILYSFLSRSGPLGSLGLLYSQSAMVLGQVALATPIIAGLSCGAAESMDPRILKTARSLGAGRLRAAWTAFGEMRPALAAATVAGFGRVFSEVGVSLILGGNIRFYTRNLTTAIALETSKGDFAFGLALGMVLLAAAFVGNAVLQALKARA